MLDEKQLKACVSLPQQYMEITAVISWKPIPNGIWKRRAYVCYNFVQDNQSFSVKGVLRGLHFQKQFPKTKLVRVIKDSVFDVAVDLRSGSATYGKYYGIELTEENKKQFLIPRGFVHGFLVLSDVTEFCYKCDDFYHANDEDGMAWNDPEIGIVWPMLVGKYNGTEVLSLK